MKRHDRLARHYIRAADLRAVYIATGAGLTRVGITRDPLALSRDLKRKQQKIEGVYWLASAAGAAKLIAAITTAFPAIGRTAPATVIAALPAIAKAARVVTTEDSIVQARALAVARDVDRRVATMQASGQLRGLNAEYRSARAGALKRGVKIMSYGDYLEQYKIRMLYEIAGAMSRQS